MYEPNERQQLLIEIAKMYYLRNMSQQQIADTLHMSRSNVSLLLKSCIDNNIIEIKINDTVSRAHEVASQLMQTFGLKTVLIAKSYHTQEQTMASVARLAVHHLRNIVRSNMLVGYTSDTMMRILAELLYFPEYTKIHTIQMLGGLYSSYQDDDGQYLARQLQKKFNGTSYVLQAPLMVKSTMLKKALLEEPIIKDVFAQFANIDIALMTIEKHIPMYGLPTNGFFSSAESLQLSELGAICHFCGHYLDRDGDPCGANINDRVISISLNDLKRIPVTIGLAAGSTNAAAVLSCIKGGYVNTLIIDEALAKSMLK